MNNEELLFKSFSEALQVEDSVINYELKYQEIPQWDSISHMLLINELESNFDIVIDTDDVIDMSSVLKAKEILEKYNVKF